MSETDLTKKLLAELAEQIDGPEGTGGGAICLDAIAAIEDLERRLPPHAHHPPDS